MLSKFIFFLILILSCKAQKTSQYNRDTSPFEPNPEAEGKSKSSDIANNIGTLEGEANDETASRLSSQLVLPLEAPLGFGGGGGNETLNADAGWWHNWGSSNFIIPSGQSILSPNANLHLKRLGLLNGGPIPSQLPTTLYFDTDTSNAHSLKIEFNVPSDAIIPANTNGIHAGYFNAWCVYPAHNCNLDKELCQREALNMGYSADHECTRNSFFQGKQFAPGCANYPNPAIKIKINNSFQTFIHPECTQKDLSDHLDPYIALVRANVKGRSWKLFNEPDDLHQDWIKPTAAAKIYNYLFPRIKNFDPRARLYCCGTHPGLSIASKDPQQLGLRAWMKDFTNDLQFALDGIHYHNYWNATHWFDSEKIIELMTDFSDELANRNPKNRPDAHLVAPKILSHGLYHSNISFGELPTLVTEWSALYRPSSNQQTWVEYLRCNPNQLTPAQLGLDPNNHNIIPDNLIKVMRPIKNWFLDQGRKTYSHIGMAWFTTVGSSEFIAGLYNKESNNTFTKTCLGQEYFNYQTEYNNKKPKIESLLTRPSCPLLNISLPSRNWGSKHWSRAIIYDAESHLPLLDLAAIAQEKGVCTDGLYWSGSGTYLDSYYRYYMSEQHLKNQLVCHPNFKSDKIMVRYEFANGVPYTPFSDAIQIAKDSSSTCYQNFIPIIAAQANTGLPGAAWSSGQQVQNTGNENARVNFFRFDSAGTLRRCDRMRTLSSGSSTTFLTDTHCGIAANSGFAGSALVTANQPIASIVNVVAQNTTKAAGQYQGTSSQNASTRLYFPLIKNNHHGRSTTIYIQNSSGGFNDLNISAKVAGNTYNFAVKKVPPFASQIVLPANLGIPSGNNNFGSMIVNSTEKISGTALEHEITPATQPTLQAVNGLSEVSAASQLYCPLFRHKHTNLLTTSGLQIQNIGPNSENIKIYYNSNRGLLGPYSRNIASLGSTNFYPPAVSNPTIPLGAVGAIKIVADNASAKLLALVNEASDPTQASMYSSYNCFAKGGTKLYLPLAKEKYLNNTTGISIQNLGLVATHITLTYKKSDNSILRIKSKDLVAPGASLVSYMPSQGQGSWKVLQGIASTFSSSVSSVTIESSSSKIVAMANEAGYGQTQMVDNKSYEAFVIE
ncbi:MAG: hypothetical protein KBD78_10205 [Oligoflexales bacterium]|nr:hypothetical protein [Oligoflexales bacterium]